MADESTNTFGRWLKTLIENIPFSQARVAREAGITDVQLSRIITGTSGVKRDTAEKIIDAINKLAGRETADKKYGLNLAGYTMRETNDTQILADQLAAGVMASGFSDLEDPELRAAFLEDMQTLAESMLKRRLQEQDRKRKEKK